VIATVTEADLPELLPLMRGYCDFYEVDPSDDALLALARMLIADTDRGLQLIARDDDGRALGFATIFWTWSTLSAAQLGVMNDLFVAQDARGGGWADALIAACVERCRERGVRELAWQTAHTNLRAQATAGLTTR
jgi:GNAT superfamily N-acetyltransferase